MNALISKQDLRVKGVFFSNSFFLYTVRKNSHGQQNMFIGERFPSLFIFFSTCHGKVILELKQVMFKFSNIFSHEKPKGFRLEKNETKKNKSIEREHNQIKGGRLNSCYFRKYKSMKIQHQQVLCLDGINFSQGACLKGRGSRTEDRGP